MQVVASLLNPTATRQTQVIWQLLEDHCGLAGIKLTPLPHFSWQSAEEYGLPKVEEILRQVAEKTTPFTVQATGIGIFTGKSPVVYTALVKTRKLLDLQEKIWQAVEPFASVLNPHYAPASWVPHVTLAYRDVTPENLACALLDLSFQPLMFDVLVDHLALIYENDGQIGIKFRYNFGG